MIATSSLFRCGRADRRSYRPARRHAPGVTCNRRPIALLRLEDRLAPAVLSYLAASGALTFTADAGEADVVSVSAPAANQIQIRVGNGDAITLGGDAVANANFVLSSSSAPNDVLTVATGPGQAPATTFVLNLGDQGDRLDFGLAATPNGVGSVAIDGQGGLIASHDIVTITAPVTVGADLSIKSETINANATITAGGSVTLTSVDTLSLSSPVVAGGDATVTADFGINLRASVSAAGNLSLRSGFSSITQSAGSITANGLAASLGNLGSVKLDQGGNDVNVFAAYVGQGTLRVADVDDLAVGAVGQTSGITVPDLGTIATLTTGGQITLTKDVICDTAVFQPAAGGIAQTDGVVKAGALVLLGSGQFILSQPGNDVGRIAANVTGPVNLTDSKSLQVFTFRRSFPYDVYWVSGITTAGHAVTLTSGRILQINDLPWHSRIDAGATGTVVLRATDSVFGLLPDQGYPNPIPVVLAANLAVSANGIRDLVTDVGRIEAHTTSRDIDITNVCDLIVGGVDANLGGIRVESGAGHIKLVSTGALTLEEGVTTADGPAYLVAGGTVTQAPTGTITADALSVQTSGGDIVLNEQNRVGTLVAKDTAAGGAVVFASTESLSVDTVSDIYWPYSPLRGISTNNGDVTLRTGGGFTAGDGNDVEPMFNLGTGKFLLTPGLRDPQTLSTPSPAHTIVFDTEIIASSVRIGVPAGDAFSNVFRDTFSIRPSANIAIDVEGNAPTSLPGDALSLIDLNGQGLTFTPGPNPGSGTFTVHGRKPLTFAGLESLESMPQATLTAFAIQTGPQTVTQPEPFAIEVEGRMGSDAVGPMFQVIAPDENPFIVTAGLQVPFTAPRLAVADVNGDALPDLIVGAGSNSAPLITVINGARLFGPQSGQRLQPEDLLAQFLAYDPAFVGGVYVAAGDFNGDGRAEIVTGAGEGGGPHVRAFEYDASGSSLSDRMRPFAGSIGNFFAYDAAFRGGVRVAVGDVNGDGTPDIVTAAGPDGGPHVRAFSGQSGAVLLSFFAYDAAFRGGVNVAAGDIDGDGRADIITGAGEGGGPQVKVFTGPDAGLYMSFFAYAADFRGGVRVAVGDWNGDGTPDIMTGPGAGGGPHVKVFSEVGGPLIGSFMASDDLLRYGVFVASGDSRDG